MIYACPGKPEAWALYLVKSWELRVRRWSELPRSCMRWKWIQDVWQKDCVTYIVVAQGEIICILSTNEKEFGCIIITLPSVRSILHDTRGLNSKSLRSISWTTSSLFFLCYHTELHGAMLFLGSYVIEQYVRWIELVN